MASKTNNEAVKNYFFKFVKTEDEALKNDSQSGWYSSNWHLAENNLLLAAKVFDEEMLLRVYVHKLRMGWYFHHKTITEKQFSLFLQAYEMHLLWLKTDHQKHPWTKSVQLFKLLFVYGFDYQTTINIQQSYEDTAMLSQAFKQFTNYQHIPGLLSKPDKFYPYAINDKVVHRTIATLDAVEFMRDSDFVMIYTGLYGALLTLLLSKLADAKDCIQRFKDSSLLAGSDEKHIERVADFSSRFELAASDYLTKIST